jgi:hypothetical protein
MSATARAPLVRAGPGVSAWTALPERDRALLVWLVEGDVVTAQLAALDRTTKGALAIWSAAPRRLSGHRL